MFHNRAAWHCLYCFGLLSFSLGNIATGQVQSWSDPKLPVTDSLSLWLDASGINAARLSTGEPALKSGEELSSWLDASGNQRHFVQNTEGSKPRIVQIGDSWTVQFDGESDSLRCVTVPSQCSDITLFLVTSPHENPGEFRGIFAANAPERRDYESGFNIDLGPTPTGQFNQLNIEGKGFGGYRDSYLESQPFGALANLEAIIDTSKQSVRLTVNGKNSGERPLTEPERSFEQLTLGARFYTNGPGPHIVRGNLKCDVAELLIYRRVLKEDEIIAVREYLSKKYQSLAKDLPSYLNLSESGIGLVKATDPPAVQMLQPGFQVFELPVELNNVNNVRFRDDGSLVTLAYNGDIHILSDRNGDGLEDHAELFWKNSGSLRGPIGMQLTPPNYPKGRGMFVPSKGKVSMIVDTDGDDKADTETVIASGWDEIAQNVDAVGIAMDADGAIYFGLGTANYANAYLVDASGKSEYRLDSDRGTVQRISPDFSKRETVCTGIRFPIAFAFNPQGDLFCSEQEGATWLANGNPFDELLHIQPNRHYGFPPRHPQYNPTVIDEPSVFDYGPQHQSTCGMVFNQSVQGGPVFGSSLWASNALVTGESRGKIWRTQLVSTEQGYVAASQLIACLQMLTIDVCVAPNGDLVVACHSGPPDWGTGPAGIGKLFRIKVSNTNAPRPVLTWAESANEIRVAFDKPLDPLNLNHLAEQVRVEYGPFVRAGDRFENLVPPYAVVQNQIAEPRKAASVASTSVTADMRTLIINTSKRGETDPYSVSLPDYTRPADQNKSIASADPSRVAAGVTELTQHANVDVDGNHNGLIARWNGKNDGDASLRTIWLPHLDLHVSRELTVGSSSHDAFWKSIKAEGELVITTKLDLDSMLRPAVQPGSKLDYDWPTESVSVELVSTTPFSLKWRDEKLASTVGTDGKHVARVSYSSDLKAWSDLSISLKTTPDTEPQIFISASTNEDSRKRAIPVRRFIMPWVKSNAGRDSSSESGGKNIAVIPELTGGNWGLGARLFASEKTGCIKCHAMNRNGGQIGPDLSNLVHRDYASVLRDIVNPSFAINPDHIGHIIQMADGTVLTGVLRTEKGILMLGDASGKSTPIDKADIEQMKSAQTSIMPAGLHDKLSKEELRDLMTYLLTPAPHMPMDSPLKAPPLRTHAELSALLKGAPTAPGEMRDLKIVLVAGDKDHGPGEHDYPAWQVQWGQLLASADRTEVQMAWDFPSQEQLDEADVLIFFQKGTWNDQRQSKLDTYLAKGKGAVYIHWAVNGDERVGHFSKRIGIASRGGNIRYRHGPLSLKMQNSDHPILRNMTDMSLYDESYWLMTGNVENVTLLASSDEDGAPQPQVWTYENGPGKVFVSIPGHYSWTFDDPLFRVLLLRGIAWTAGEPVDRFNALASPGARMAK